jgi:hypothetical protein
MTEIGQQFQNIEPFRPKKWITEDDFAKVFPRDGSNNPNYSAEEKQAMIKKWRNQDSIKLMIGSHANQYNGPVVTWEFDPSINDTRRKVHPVPEETKENAIQKSLELLKPYGATREHVLQLYDAHQKEEHERIYAGERAYENSAGVNGPQAQRDQSGWNLEDWLNHHYG